MTGIRFFSHFGWLVLQGEVSVKELRLNAGEGGTNQHQSPITNIQMRPASGNSERDRAIRFPINTKDSPEASCVSRRNGGALVFAQGWVFVQLHAYVLELRLLSRTEKRNSCQARPTAPCALMLRDLGWLRGQPGPGIMQCAKRVACGLHFKNWESGFGRALVIDSVGRIAALKVGRPRCDVSARVPVGGTRHPYQNGHDAPAPCPARFAD